MVLPDHEDILKTRQAIVNRATSTMPDSSSVIIAGTGEDGIQARQIFNFAHLENQSLTNAIDIVTTRKLVLKNEQTSEV